MKIKLTAITVYLNNSKLVQCVRCNFTGRFLKRIVGINALQAIKQAKKAMTLKAVYSCLATCLYTLAILLPFVLCVFFNINGMNLHDSILAAGLLSVLFSTFSMLIGMQCQDTATDLNNEIKEIKA